MKIVALNCNECGASLEVGARTRFVTCAFCSTRLQIHHSGGAHFSEVLEAIEKKTDALVDEVAGLKRQSALEALDKEWERERTQYMAHNDNGQAVVPTVAGSIIAGLVASAFGVFWIVFTSRIPGSPFWFSLFGIVFIAVAWFGVFTAISKANQYQGARRRYIERRTELTR